LWEAAEVAVLALLEVRWSVIPVETAATGWNGPQGPGLTTQVEAAAAAALAAGAGLAAAGTLISPERPTLAAVVAANLTTPITVQAALES